MGRSSTFGMRHLVKRPEGGFSDICDLSAAMSETLLSELALSWASDRRKVGRFNPRAGRSRHEDTPVQPHAIRYTIEIVSPASGARIEALTEAVDRYCPIRNPIRGMQTLKGTIGHVVLEEGGDGRIDAIHEAA